MIKTLDHLIVAVSDINEAEKNYSTVFGAGPVWRGEHVEYGTENSLFNFNNTYFELLAAKGEGFGAALVNHALQETGEGLIEIVFGTDNLKEIHELLAASGETEVNLIIRNQNKQAIYSLQNNRKFDLNHLKALKSKDYVEKITV